MRFLRDLPIRRKLVVLLMMVTGGALLLAGAALLALDALRFRQDLAADLQTLAEVIAQNSTAAVTFHDADAAMETLAALAARRDVRGACIYDQEGRRFAQWTRREARLRFPQAPGPAPGPDGFEIRRDSIALFQPILLAGEPIGTVYVEGGLSELYDHLWVQAATIAGVFLAAALAALALSAWLQALISRPIHLLAQTAREVSERRDYRIRARKESADELGQLVDDFNDMLAQIEARDSELLAAKDALEERVRERTLELRQELAERQRAEQELEQRNTELHQSNRELDDFAYIASHDLKEPLRGIHNYSTFLLEDYAGRLDDDGRAKLETLTRLTRRMEVLIDSLLQFSRLGRVDLAMDRVDLNAIVEEVLDSLAIHLREEGVEVAIPRPLPTVHCDRVRVGEIFHNLIVNAVKYNDKPRKLVEIGFLDGEDPPVFYVRDNGIGIQEKHFESIFRIFKRLHGRDKFGGGTGAGLTIVKKIVERHHGRIWVESAFGEGTTFYFTLGKGDSLAEQPADPAR